MVPILELVLISGPQDWFGTDRMQFLLFPRSREIIITVVIWIFDWHWPSLGVKAREAGSAHGQHRLPLDRRPRHRSQGRFGQDRTHNARVHQRRREDRAQPESGGPLEAHRLGPDPEGRQGGADLELIGDLLEKV